MGLRLGGKVAYVESPAPVQAKLSSSAEVKIMGGVADAAPDSKSPDWTNWRMDA
jgi:hypothetical protein